MLANLRIEEWTGVADREAPLNDLQIPKEGTTASFSVGGPIAFCRGRVEIVERPRRNMRKVLRTKRHYSA